MSAYFKTNTEIYLALFNRDIQYEDIRFFDMKLLFILSAVRPEIRKKINKEMNGMTYLMQALDIILDECIAKANLDSNTPNIMLSVSSNTFINTSYHTFFRICK